jgi:hypothetical protein
VRHKRSACSLACQAGERRSDGICASIEILRERADAAAPPLTRARGRGRLAFCVLSAPSRSLRELFIRWLSLIQICDHPPRMSGL